MLLTLVGTVLDFGAALGDLSGTDYTATCLAIRGYRGAEVVRRRRSLALGWS